MEIVKRMFVEEEGQGMVEYGLIIGLIAILLIGGLTAMRGGLENIFGDIGTTLTNTNAP
ncbi:Flp family type IVb pilin [Brevibacillus sp. H7]|jgi:pilus assembly protein Flp/PilA|uniref:Flp family type IVb pilin n=1 Tax=Brevibacillus sp. H7 TaxID=3349138 RepID=UPI00381E7F55